MTKAVYSHLAGLCGDYCGKCPNYPQECEGCVPKDKPDCHFVACCATRGLEHCGHCKGLPCAKLSGFCPDDSNGCPPGYHIDNLRRRTSIGTEAWLAEQRKIWGR